MTENIFATMNMNNISVATSSYTRCCCCCCISSEVWQKAIDIYRYTKAHSVRMGFFLFEEN